MRVSLRDWIAIGLLFGVALFYFSDWFFKEQIVVFRDVSRYYYPLRSWTVQCFKQGIFPLWNPYILLGTPHLAAIQSAVLYPLSLIYYLGSFPRMFNLFIGFHFLLSGWFFYFLMRDLGYSRIAALFSAISWMLSGFLVSTINLLTTLSSVSWFPLAILLFRRSLQSKESRWAILSGWVLTLMMLAGEPGITCVILWIFLGYALVHRRFWPWLVSASVFLGTSLFQLIPLVEFVLNSERSSMNFNQATAWSVPPQDLWNLFIPFVTDPWIPRQDYWVRQSWLASYYVGVLPWIFWIWMIFYSRNQKVIFLTLGLLLSLLVVSGHFSPLYHFLYSIVPGISWIRYPVRLFFLPTFFICLLLAHGIDCFQRDTTETQNSTETQRKGISYLFWGLLSSMALLFIHFRGELLWRGFLTHPQERFFVQIVLLSINRTCFLWGVGWLLFWAMVRFQKIRSFGFVLLGILLVWDLLDIHQGINPTLDIREFTKVPQSVEFLKTQKDVFRIAPSPKTFWLHQYLPAGDFRSASLDSFERCVSNRLVQWGIADVSGYESLYLKRYGDMAGILLHAQSPRDTSLYNLLNARFILTPDILESAQENGLSLVYQSPQIRIYQNHRVLNRVFLVPRWRFTPNPELILEQIRKPDFDPSQEVWLEGNGERPLFWKSGKNTPQNRDLSQDSGLTPDKVEMISYRPNKVQIKMQISSEQALVLSDAYYPGWKGTIDGEQIPIYRADFFLRAILVPSGHHWVDFVYHPWWFPWCMVISLAILLLTFWRLNWTFGNLPRRHSRH